MPARHHIALDAWRGIAALIVALFHFATPAAISQSTFLRNSWLFVDFFFVLSGFVIAANYRGRLAQGFGIERFMLLRLGRLYPLHILMLAAFIATELLLYLASGAQLGSGRVYFAGQTSVLGIFTNLLLVQGIGFHDGLSWNGVAWSISTETWTYLVFALLAVKFARRLELAMLLLIAGVLVFVLPEGLRPPGVFRFVDFARCLYGFAVGVLLQALFKRLTGDSRIVLPGEAAFTALEFAATGLALTFLMFAAHLPRHLVAPLAFAPAVLVYAFDRGKLSHILQTPFCMLLGTLSYSIYMIHPFVQTRIMLPAALGLQSLTHRTLVTFDSSQDRGTFIWGMSEWQGDTAIFVMLGLLLACSWLTYRFVEAPGRDCVRRLVARGK